MRPNVMDDGSMAGGDDSAVRRFAGDRITRLSTAATLRGTALDAQWQSAYNKAAATRERSLEARMPRGYSWSGAPPLTQSSGPDYKAIGSQIGEGLKELGLFGGLGRSTSRPASSGSSGFGDAFGSGFDADQVTRLAWSTPSSLFS